MFVETYNVVRHRSARCPSTSGYIAEARRIQVGVVWLRGVETLILFKTCPRCGGDVDATYDDDVYCVQCAYRPAVAVPGRRAVEAALGVRLGAVASETDTPRAGPSLQCTKCSSQLVVALDKVRLEDHTCYRCRACGHIFSPRDDEARRQVSASSARS